MSTALQKFRSFFVSPNLEQTKTEEKASTGNSQHVVEPAPEAKAYERQQQRSKVRL